MLTPLTRIFGRSTGLATTLGTGRWRRTYDYSVASAKRIQAGRVLNHDQLQVVVGALRHVRTLAAEGYAASPGDSLDALGSEARTTYDQAISVERGLREVEHRASLVAEGDATQEPALRKAIARLSAQG
jgi:hypothetical protein